jgi:membrane protease YdiL (CAAX protease family)
MRKAVHLASILLISVALGGGLAHLFELPHKMQLDREEYLTVQQIYRGWALLGIPILGGLACSAALAVLYRKQRTRFWFAVCAVGCIVAALAVFFAVTFPVNQATQNWTELPENWRELRRQWEYSHAVGAVLQFAALTALAAAALVEPDR